MQIFIIAEALVGNKKVLKGEVLKEHVRTYQTNFPDHPYCSEVSPYLIPSGFLPQFLERRHAHRTDLRTF
jgi:hypothetical protein